MYADVITLFNRYDSGADDVWYPTVLRGVDLNIDKAAIVATYGENSTDNARLHIRYGFVGNDAKIGDKTYLPPKEWKAQNSEVAKNCITFTSGQDFDFFIVGEWGSTEPVNDVEYIDGFYNFCNNIYDFCFAVTSVAQYSVIPHFEIMAR